MELQNHPIMKFLLSTALMLASMLHGAEVQPVPAASPAEHWQTTSENGVRYKPASSRVEELFNTVGARVLLESKTEQWDASGAHASFTAVVIYEPTAKRIERGLRLELSRGALTETIYVDETVFPALRQVMANYTAHLPTADDCVPGNPSGARLAWLFDPPHRAVHLLNTAVYFDADTGSPGILLGRGFKTPGFKGDYRFPGKLPEALDKVLDAVETRFGNANSP